MLPFRQRLYIFEFTSSLSVIIPKTIRKQEKKLLVSFLYFNTQFKDMIYGGIKREFIDFIHAVIKNVLGAL